MNNIIQQTPSNEAEWNAVADKFDSMWNFPNCIGAIDGKHVAICAPPNSGSVFFNYKGTHSIILMGIADAEYKFIYLDVGCNGRVSDGGVFNKCSFAALMENNQLNLPSPRPLPRRTVPVPYVLVADDAFAIRPNNMKPFSGRGLNSAQRVFNYRLSRARRIIENTFGILSARFRVLRNSINLDAAKTRKVALACCVLHNFLVTRNCATYAPPTSFDRTHADGECIPADWRAEAPGISLFGCEQVETRYIGNDV